MINANRQVEAAIEAEIAARPRPARRGLAQGRPAAAQLVEETLAAYTNPLTSAMQAVADVVAPAATATPPVVETQAAVPPTDAEVSAQIELQIQEMMAGSRNVNTQIDMQEVKLYPHHVELEIAGITKSISWIDFKRLIDEQLKVDTKLEPMVLPTGCYMFARSAANLQLACYYPERRADIEHQGNGRESGVTTYKNVLFPNMIITHTLSNQNGVWVVTESRYLVTDKKVNQLPENEFLLSPDVNKRLWRVPFTNFYDEGKMCYGQNTMPVRYNQNLRGLDYYYNVIFASPFNNDLGINVPEYESNIPGWYKLLTEVDAFPYDKLSTRRTNW